jgi:hypothetical protein
VVFCWCFDRREIAEQLQSISGFYRGDRVWDRVYDIYSEWKVQVREMCWI